MPKEHLLGVPSGVYSFEFQASEKEAYDCSDSKGVKGRAHRSSSKHKKQGKQSLCNQKKAEPIYEESKMAIGNSLASGLYPDANFPSKKELLMTQKSSGKPKPYGGQIVQEGIHAKELKSGAADHSTSSEQDQSIVSNPFFEGSYGKGHLWPKTDGSVKFEGNVNPFQKAMEDEDYYNDSFLQNEMRNNTRQQLRSSFQDAASPSYACIQKIQHKTAEGFIPRSDIATSSTSFSSELGSTPAVMNATIKEKDLSESSASYIPADKAGTDIPMPALSSGVPATNSSFASMIHMTAAINFEDKDVAQDMPESSTSYSLADKAEIATPMLAFSSAVSPTNSSAPLMTYMQESEIGVPSGPAMVKSITSEQICEQWRLKGNRAYASGNFLKAEEYYSRGASSISPDETSQSCIRASMLCYSNRAVTRMAVGRMREALSDCMRAMTLDSISLRGTLRAASCHLALGETESAAILFEECLRLSKGSDNEDTRIVAEAAEGLKKVQHLNDYTTKALELLRDSSTSNANAALQLINDSLIVSPHSEHLLQLKGETLLSLQRYEEVIELCEGSLASSERNHPDVVNEAFFGNASAEAYMTQAETTSVKLWRWEIIAKSLFCLGKPEDSLPLIAKYEEANSKIIQNMSTQIKTGKGESMATFSARIRKLLHHKIEGDAEFQVGKHAEAVEQYSQALACSKDSYIFTAACFCSRAAASQAVGDILDAIADCSRAIAFDPNSTKAISQRAILYEIVRDYGQARHDLKRLIALLESYQRGTVKCYSGRLVSDIDNTLYLNQAWKRLRSLEEEMEKGYPHDHYVVLGVKPSCSANDIRKGYRKAALRHHPDKASQFLLQADAGEEERLWKDIGRGIRDDAEHLFKIIGKSYAILSDPAKRLRYDTDEELRKGRTLTSSDARQARKEPYVSQYAKDSKLH